MASSWSDYYSRVLDTMMTEFDADGIYQDGVMARPCQRGAPLSYDDLTPDVVRAEFGRQWGPESIILPQLSKKQIIPTAHW